MQRHTALLVACLGVALWGTAVARASDAHGGHHDEAHAPAPHAPAAPPADHGEAAHDAHGDAHAAPAKKPAAKKPAPAKKPSTTVEADGTFTIHLDEDGDSPSPAEPAHDAHAEPAHDAHAEPAHDAHAEPAHDAPKPKPKRKPKPRDWKPLRGTGVAPGRVNKWGIVEALPPQVAARLRVGYTGDEVEFPNHVLFKHDSIAFEPSAEAVLREIASTLQSSPEIDKLWIEGHTDLTGDLRYNQKLSEARASAVREALVALGVAPERLVAYGRGEARPATTSARGRPTMENRRVVFRMVSADKPALLERKPKEFARAAVVGVRGTVRWRLNPLAATMSQAGTTSPAGALASNEDDETVYAAEAEQEAQAQAEAQAMMDAASGDGEASSEDEERSFAAEAEAELAGTADHEAPNAQGWAALTFRQALVEGSEVDTGPTGNVLIRLPDLSRVQLDLGSLAQFTKLFASTRENKTYAALRFERGHARLLINPDRRGTSKTLLAWPGGSAEVVSAEVELDVDAEGRGRIAVRRGDARVSNGGAVSTTLSSGQWMAFGKGEGPRILPTAPDLVSPLQGDVAAPELVWSPVAGARGYRVEVAEDVNFHQVLHVLESSADVTRARSPDLPEGRPWYWRVFATTDDGIAGLSSRIYAFRVGPAATTTATETAPR